MSKIDKNKSSGKKKANIKLSEELKTQNFTLRKLMHNIGVAMINKQKENKNINQKPKS